MTTMPSMSSPANGTSGTLGALVRAQREHAGLSMNQLADRSRVSRSTIHRLEHNFDIRPTPSKLAHVLAVLGIDKESIRSTLPDDQFRSDLLHWMDAVGEAGDIAQALEEARGPVTPDLVAIHRDGTVARIVGGGAHLDELADALKRIDWLVTRPA